MRFGWARSAMLAGLSLSLVGATTTAAAGAEGGSTDAAGTRAAAAVTATGERYVALGDSFVAGPGIQPFSNPGCDTSSRNFPALLATSLGATLVDASCSGATLANLELPQVRGTYIHPAQLDSVTEDTDLVTFGTLGGNDVDLVGLAYDCFLGECVGTPGDYRHVAVDALRPTIDQAIADIRAKAIDADVVVVGYSQYVPPASCSSIAAITPTEATYLQGLIDHLSEVLEDAATDAGVGFADMNAIPGLADHTVCAAPEKQWVRGVNTYDDGAPLHPSSCGMAAYAQQVRAAVQQLRGQAVDAFVDPCPAPAPPTTSPTPTPTPTPTPAPTVDSAAALKAAAASTRLVRGCLSGERVRLKVRGGKGLVSRVVFRVGSKRVGTDRSAPFKIVRPADRLSRHRGKVKAVVVLRHGGERMTHRISKSRPRCLR